MVPWCMCTSRQACAIDAAVGYSETWAPTHYLRIAFVKLLVRPQLRTCNPHFAKRGAWSGTHGRAAPAARRPSHCSRCRWADKLKAVAEWGVEASCGAWLTCACRHEATLRYRPAHLEETAVAARDTALQDGVEGVYPLFTHFLTHLYRFVSIHLPSPPQGAFARLVSRCTAVRQGGSAWGHSCPTSLA